MEHRNPVPTIDLIVEREQRILMIRRKNDPFKGFLALPGGFIDYGETAEQAAIREAREEVSLEIEPIEILGVYSDPKRDPRKHVMSTVFIAIVVSGEARASDDAASAEWISVLDLNSSDKQIAFDHKLILNDYFEWKRSGGTYWSTKRRSS